MCLFCKKKKKKHTALKVLAIVFTSLAALAGLYLIFDRFFRDKIRKKLDKGCEDECADLTAEIEAADDAVVCCDEAPAELD